MAFSSITPYPYYPSPLTNITPFSYRDGATYLEVLERLKTIVNETLVAQLNEIIAEMNDSANETQQKYADDLNAFIATINDQFDALARDAAKIAVDDYLAEPDTLDNAVTEKIQAIDSAIYAALTAFTQAFVDNYKTDVLDLAYPVLDENGIVSYAVLPAGSTRSGVTNTISGINAGAVLDVDAFTDGTGNGGYNNTIYGADAGKSLTDGLRNTVMGTGAAAAMVTGFYNDAIGDGALRDLVGPTSVTGTPSGALGCRNTGVGSNALAHVTTGHENVALGRNAGHTISTGANNVAVGRNAYSGRWVSDDPAQQDKKTANENVAVGDSALFNTNADGNVGVGDQALYTNAVGQGNTGIGWHSLYGATGSFNTAVGYAAVAVMGEGVTEEIWNGTAIGRGSEVRHNNSVALGSRTVTHEVDTVSVGPRSMDMEVSVTPQFPVAGVVRINAIADAVTGKLELRALWPSGTETTIALEP